MRSSILVVAALVFLEMTAVQGQSSDVNRPGNGTSTPQLLQEVKPNYTPEAQAAKIQGTDQEAVKAVKQWTFKPGTKDGKPVAVRVSIEIACTLPRK